MRSISDTAGSNSDSSTSWEDGDITNDFTRKDYYQNLIARANTVPLIRVFKLYGLRVDEQSRKIICPFKHHKGGHESTPSFYYYADTNSFRCYGCGVGHQYAHGCEFVSAMESISKVKAAFKILEHFSSDVDDDVIVNKHDFSERLQIMMDFSNTVREFRQTYVDEKSQKFIENICWVYDQHNLKHDHTNEALRHVVEQLKEKIISHTCQI